MAASLLTKPGTSFGPCSAECTHSDCAATRKMAAQLCTECRKPIGYDTRFYSAPIAVDNGDLTHARCLEVSK